jgi:hypothetical protein
MSASVVLAPKLTLMVEAATSGAIPMAASTWLGFIDPDEQALPALTEMPARSSWTSWLAELTPGIATPPIVARRAAHSAMMTPPSERMASSSRARRPASRGMASRTAPPASAAASPAAPGTSDVPRR